MFNPSFIDKYEMYATFKQHEKLTAPITSNHDHHKLQRPLLNFS